MTSPHETFSMPCLSGYRFYPNGDCYSVSTGLPVEKQRIELNIVYDVRNDYGLTETIYRDEIITYCKHLEEQQSLTKANETRVVTYRTVKN